MPNFVSSTSLAAAMALALAAIFLVFFGDSEACAASSSTPAETNRIYSDPLGRFTAPVPAGWTATTDQGIAVIKSPDGSIKLSITVEEGVERDDVVEAAWALVSPTQKSVPTQVMQGPSRAGMTETWVYNYAPQDGRFIQAIADVYKNQVYVTLIEGDQVEIGRRQAQLAIVLSGFAPSGIALVDLSKTIANPLLPREIDELSSYVEDAMKRFDVPGAAVAVVQGDQVLMLKGFGVKKRGSADPITPQTRMMIGSTGKTMTTMLLAHLVDEGVLDWDTPVQNVLPQFAVADPELSKRITVRNLVCACTGVPRRDMEFIFNASTLTAERVIDQLKSFEFFTAFGEAFQYSNQLVATAGWVAAAATGSEYGKLDDGYFDLIEDRVFGRIGMASTTFSFENVVASGDYAFPHEFGTSGLRQPIAIDEEKVLLPVAPAGASWSTAEDMAKYLITQLNRGVAPNGVRVVSPENLLVTREPQVPVSSTMHYGLGWFVDSYKGQPMIQHGGNTLGFTSDFAFLPDSGLGIVVLTNARASNDFSQAVRNRLFELAFDQPMEFDAQASLAHAQLTAQFDDLANLVPVTAAQVGPFLGRYANPALGEVELRLDGDALMLDIGETVMELRLKTVEANGDLRLIVTTGLVAQTPVTLRPTNEAQLLFGEGVERYEFHRSDRS